MDEGLLQPGAAPFIVRATVATVSGAAYDEFRRAQAAGTLGELFGAELRSQYEALGATHWLIRRTEHGMALTPVRVLRWGAD